MDNMTVIEVSHTYGVSARMLRYYEQIGLLQSSRRSDYAYRTYDTNAVLRLRQILLLRRLRLSLQSIRIILDNPDASTTLKVLEEKLQEVGVEIQMLEQIRHLLLQLCSTLKKGRQNPGDWIDHSALLLNSIENLPRQSTWYKEEKMARNDWNTQNPALLQDVRILYLPPFYVASAHYIGDDPEDYVGRMIDDYVRESDLLTRKPDLRHFGFNHPNPTDSTGSHGYEMWVTIPEDERLPEGLKKKFFPGGLYAAHMISMGNFHEWEWLLAWVNKSEKYLFAGDWNDDKHMHGLLEEHLNYVGHLKLPNTEPEELQLDLLVPIRDKI